MDMIADSNQGRRQKEIDLIVKKKSGKVSLWNRLQML